MITNIRLDLDDDQRRQVASLLTGKPVRRLATRQEIVRFVEEAFEMELRARRWESEPVGARGADTPEPETAGTRSAVDETLHRVRNRDRDTLPEFCDSDCCTQNRLLLNRVNVLQHRLDKSR